MVYNIYRWAQIASDKSIPNQRLRKRRKPILMSLSPRQYPPYTSAPTKNGSLSAMSAPIKFNYKKKQNKETKTERWRKKQLSIISFEVVWFLVFSFWNLFFFFFERKNYFGNSTSTGSTILDHYHIPISQTHLVFFAARSLQSPLPFSFLFLVILIFP